MVKAAKKRSRCDRAKKLGSAMERGVLGQGPVSPEAVVVVGVCAQDPAQVRLAQDHDMIQAVSPDRADEPFDMSVLHRAIAVPLVGRGYPWPRDVGVLDGRT